MRVRREYEKRKMEPIEMSTRVREANKHAMRMLVLDIK